MEQRGRAPLEALLASDAEIALWWATPVECRSALSRLRREGVLDAKGERDARHILTRLEEAALVVQPTAELRERSLLLLDLHPVRAADALQLAAALVCAGDRTRDLSFVCLDQRLRDAARKHGLDVVPEDEQLDAP